MTYQDPMRCPSHQPLRSNWIGSYWLRRSAPAYEITCAGSFSLELSSSQRFCFAKNVGRKEWNMLREKLENTSLQGTRSSTFLWPLQPSHQDLTELELLQRVSLATLREPTGLQESWNLSLQSDSLFPLLEWLCLLLRSKRSLSSCHVLLRLKGGLQYQMVILGLKLAHNLTTVCWNRKMQYIDIYIYCLRLHLSSGKPVKR